MATIAVGVNKDPPADRPIHTPTEAEIEAACARLRAAGVYAASEKSFRDFRQWV
jgi:hypothetical protein